MDPSKGCRFADELHQYAVDGICLYYLCHACFASLRGPWTGCQVLEAYASSYKRRLCTIYTLTVQCVCCRTVYVEHEWIHVG